PVMYGKPPRLDEAGLQELAWQRFQRSGDRILQWVNQYDWDTAVYIALARVLGYSKNSRPFELLMRQLPPAKLEQMVHPLQRSPLLVWALLGWQSGLFQRPFRSKEAFPAKKQLQYLVRIRQQFSHLLPAKTQPLINWQFSRLRPVNNPYFRLAGLSQVIHQYPSQKLFSRLESCFSAREQLPSLLQKIENLLALPLSTTFTPFFRELLGYRGLPERAIGKNRIRQFVLNMLLPFFYQWAGQQGSSGYQLYLEDLYFQFPACDNNHVLRHFSSPGVSKISRKAFYQQACLEYYRQNTLAGERVCEKSVDSFEHAYLHWQPYDALADFCSVNRGECAESNTFPAGDSSDRACRPQPVPRLVKFHADDERFCRSFYGIGPAVFNLL
ncbi:MAG: DUF2851 family protein, partial [Calditrichia bacterium]